MRLPSALALLAFLFAPLFAWAHDPGLSSVSVVPEDDDLTVMVTFARYETIAGESGAMSVQALDPREAITLSAGGRLIPPLSASTRLDAVGNNVECVLRFPANPLPGEKLTLQSPLLERLSPGHRQFLTVREPSGRPLQEQLLSVSANAATLDLATPEAAPRALPAFAGFIALGFEHILIGYDHLLFLCVLLLIATSFGDAFRIITCFTLSHSLTLALATLGIVEIPARLVESLIAASIIYVALENVVTRGKPRGRYALTFAFGLVHGLGFASVLRELGIAHSGTGVLVPLLGFNLGVELGQIAVAAVVFPALNRLRFHPVWMRRWVPACSLGVALLGAFWLFDRLAAA